MHAVLSIARDRRALALSAGALCAVCWAFSLREAGRMHHGAGVWPLFAMWAVMMAGMMIPGELPNVVSAPRGGAFLAGFLAVWIAFSLGAAALHAWLEGAGYMDHGMALTGRALPAALLAVAGAAQLSPLKRRCLQGCREAASRGGLRAGLVSVGSCGLLMLVPFVVGVMSVPAMVSLTALLVLERALPERFGVSALAGAGLLLLAGWKLLA